MAILPSNVKLLESQRMTDTTDGGGRMTNHEIPDNVAGNLFPKISRVDSVYGRINMRKFYLGIDTASLDVYAGANVGVFQPPANPNVNITLFTTQSDFDTRADAQNRIEGYVIKGVKSRMKLFGDQIIGQKAILVYQKTTEQLPEIGETYLLSVEKTGYTPAEQYIRVGDLKYEDREFTLSAGGAGEQTFTRRVITLGLTNPLKQTFPGAEITPYEDTGSPTIVRETNVADTAQYYGIQPLTGSYAPGVMSVKAASMFAPLVPSTNRETAIGLASISASLTPVICSSPSTTITFNPGRLDSVKEFPISIHGNISKLLIGVNPASLSSKDRTLTILDLKYKIVNQSPLGLSLVSGGYEWSGISLGWNFSNIVAYMSHPSHTQSIPVTLGTQGLVQSLVCTPIPAPGTLFLDYRSNGRWYRLVDDGAGVVADADGNTALGSGKLSFIDGSLIVTLGALPDVGSSLLLSWGSYVHYELLSVSTPTINPPTVRQTLAADAAGNVLVPGGITASWGTGLSVTDDGHGKFTGSAGSGTINYATRQVFLQFASLPAPNTIVQWTYNQAAPNAGSPQNVTAASTTGNLQLDSIGGGSLKAGSVRIVATVGFPNSITSPVTFLDDGNGNLIAQPVSFEVNNNSYKLPKGYGTYPSGTIDYVSGNAVIYPATGSASYWIQGVGWQFGNYTGTWASNTATCYFSLTTDALSAKTDSTTIDKLQIDLTPYTANALVPNALLFDTCGREYYDKQGTLYDQFDHTTGSGHIAGSLDYSTGIATLTEWVAGSSPAFTLKAGLTKFGDFWVYDANWRVPGSPLRPASLYVQIGTADGRLIAGSSDQNGHITGPEMDGHVQQEMGVVNVRFGAMVLDSSLTPAEKAEPWYSAANVDGTGHIWRPTKCMPETLRYSCVVLSQLPLDPALLGLDPVRLPRDGRVPIFRPANIVVLHNTREDAAPTLSAEQTIQISRAPFDVFMILDATGKKLDPALYTIDLDTGVLTMATPLDLTGYTAPYRLRHRIEEENLVSRTQIDGTIELTRPTTYTHDASSYISSMLVFGDLQARYTNLFDQQTWTGAWSDTLIGAAANATFDDLNYPIEVLNNGAVNERWRIEFTSSTAFNVVGEHLGVIATGNTSTDIAVTNNLTGNPYFVLRKGGWGLGWAAGNQLRFNTLGATGSIWAARTILSGAAVTGDAFVIERRGDVD